MGSGGGSKKSKKRRARPQSAEEASPSPAAASPKTPAPRAQGADPSPPSSTRPDMDPSIDPNDSTTWSAEYRRYMRNKKKRSKRSRRSLERTREEPSGVGDKGGETDGQVRKDGAETAERDPSNSDRLETNTGTNHDREESSKSKKKKRKKKRKSSSKSDLSAIGSGDGEGPASVELAATSTESKDGDSEKSSVLDDGSAKKMPAGRGTEPGRENERKKQATSDGRDAAVPTKRPKLEPFDDRPIPARAASDGSARSPAGEASDARAPRTDAVPAADGAGTPSAKKQKRKKKRKREEGGQAASESAVDGAPASRNGEKKSDAGTERKGAVHNGDAMPTEPSKKKKKSKNKFKEASDEAPMMPTRSLPGLDEEKGAGADAGGKGAVENDDEMPPEPSKKKKKSKKKSKEATSDVAAAAPATPTKSPVGGAATAGQSPTLTVRLPDPSRMSTLQRQFLERLTSSRFRELNETLYTRPSADSFEQFTASPELFDQYHEGFQKQAREWPVNPVDVIYNKIVKAWKDRKGGGKGPVRVADFGCGDAKLAERLLALRVSADGKSLTNRPAKNGKKKGGEADGPFEVHSFDLVSGGNPLVTPADMCDVPLADGSVDVAVYSLALMGTNVADFVREAWRVLRFGGVLRVAEVRSRFETASSSSSDKRARPNGHKHSKLKKGRRDSRDSRGAQKGGDKDGEHPLMLLDEFLALLERCGFRSTNLDRSNKMFLFMDFEKVEGSKGLSEKESFTAKACIYKRR